MEKDFFLIFDGEIVCLVNFCCLDFEYIQVWGCLKRLDKIQELVNVCLCCFFVFDLLECCGEDILFFLYLDWKKLLYDFMFVVKFFVFLDFYVKEMIQYVFCYDYFDLFWEMVMKYDGEGIVVKKINSKWFERKWLFDWFKYKNFK